MPSPQTSPQAPQGLPKSPFAPGFTGAESFPTQDETAGGKGFDLELPFSKIGIHVKTLTDLREAFDADEADRQRHGGDLQKAQEDQSSIGQAFKAKGMDMHDAFKPALDLKLPPGPVTTGGQLGGFAGGILAPMAARGMFGPLGALEMALLGVGGAAATGATGSLLSGSSPSQALLEGKDQGALQTFGEVLGPAVSAFMARRGISGMVKAINPSKDLLSRVRVEKPLEGAATTASIVPRPPGSRQLPFAAPSVAPGAKEALANTPRLPSGLVGSGLEPQAMANVPVPPPPSMPSHLPQEGPYAPTMHQRREQVAKTILDNKLATFKKPVSSPGAVDAAQGMNQRSVEGIQQNFQRVPNATVDMGVMHEGIPEMQKRADLIGGESKAGRTAIDKFVNDNLNNPTFSHEIVPPAPTGMQPPPSAASAAPAPTVAQQLTDALKNQKTISLGGDAIGEDLFKGMPPKMQAQIMKELGLDMPIQPPPASMGHPKMTASFSPGEGGDIGDLLGPERGMNAAQPAQEANQFLRKTRDDIEYRAGRTDTAGHEVRKDPMRRLSSAITESVDSRLPNVDMLTGKPIVTNAQHNFNLSKGIPAQQALEDAASSRSSVPILSSREALGAMAGIYGTGILPHTDAGNSHRYLLPLAIWAALTGRPSNVSRIATMLYGAGQHPQAVKAGLNVLPRIGASFFGGSQEPPQ